MKVKKLVRTWKLTVEIAQKYKININEIFKKDNMKIK